MLYDDTMQTRITRYLIKQAEHRYCCPTRHEGIYYNLTASAHSLLLCTNASLHEVTWNDLEGENSAVGFRPAKCTLSTPRRPSSSSSAIISHV